jgi:secreted PhoX family phosphatase
VLDSPNSAARDLPDGAPDRAVAPPEPAAHTRRGFVRGVAVAGASTVAAVALDRFGGTSLMGDSAVAAGPPTPFHDFRAIGQSAADQFEVPEGFRADVVISWDDEFENTDGTKLRYGFNNDFLAFMPLPGKTDEALLFVNHEYPAPFFQHGNADPKTKTVAQIEIEQYSVGNSIVHVRRGAEGTWQVVSPSPYNRRITGSTPACAITGPLSGTTQKNADGTDVTVEATAAGSLANCSGGITPWGTALSCEENYDGYYGDSSAFAYGWKQKPGTEKYDEKTFAHYGWVVEHDPYDASSTPRKHTALGRFRHENTAFRHVPGKRFVLYMGDDKVNEGVYKFVSSRKFVEGRREENLKILTEGQLFIAKWSPEGRRRFKSSDGSGLLTATSGRGEWILVDQADLVDTSALLRKRYTSAEFDKYFGTNRPEDVEVDADGTVLIAFTNNSGVNDRHGAIRKLREDNNDPTAATFSWEDYAEGGPTGRSDVGEQGFSSCDNLCFDGSNNLWVVTDISSSSLNSAAAPYYAYHGNNAVFMVPRSGPNAGIAYRFANMPIDAEGTGPYFSADGSTLFVNVQHPGEETSPAKGAVYGQPTTYRSYWPDGNKTAAQTPSLPRPSTVAITRIPTPAGPGTPAPGPGAPAPTPGTPGGSTTIPPAPTPPGGPGPVRPPGKTTVVAPSTVKLTTLTGRGLKVSLTVREAARVQVRLRVRLPRLGRSRSKTITAVTVRRTVGAGRHEVTLRPGAVARTAMRLRRGTTLRGEVQLEVTPVDGSPKKVRRTDAVRIR